ncbi:MAG: hypothetical protein KAS04_00965 [Candidatus Aenigmarchaeota archaeon]|nr:hypothetical protein [Candidatus Aenigmarchaeota archaeon]
MIFTYVSGLKEDTSEIKVNELLDFAVNAAEKCLNEKRLDILEIISAHAEPKTITSAVDNISKLLDCPKSTVWMNVNFLKEMGLIKNGRGFPVKVTPMGMIILEKKLEDGKA